MVCAQKGYPLVLLMADSFSLERRRLMRMLGARAVLTRRAEKGIGMYRKATELAEKHGWFLARQFETDANADIHEATTAREIVTDFSGDRLDHVVTGFGTGGTVTGLARVLRRERPETRIILSEPANAAMIASGVGQDRQVMDWLRQMMGFPAGASGTLVNGGSMANIVGLTAARNAMAGVDLHVQNVTEIGAPLRVYASDQVHTCHMKAMNLLGLGRKALVRIATDTAFRMDVDPLRAAIRADRDAGLRPACVIATTGTTNTGAIDPLPALRLMAQTATTVVCFRHAPDGMDETDLRAHNTEIMLRIQESSIAVITDTTIRGRHCLRAAICNHRTQTADLDLPEQEVLRIGAAMVQRGTHGAT